MAWKVDPMNNEPKTDPRLDALLDGLLSPESLPGGIPTGMADRIVAATGSKLRGQHHSVLARIGPAQWMAVAAVLLLALGAAVWFRAAAITTPATPPSNRLALSDLRHELDAIHRDTSPGEAIDQDLAMLGMQVDRSQSGWETPQLFDTSADDWDFAAGDAGTSMIF
jgi:hypothetical protein